MLNSSHREEEKPNPQMLEQSKDLAPPMTDFAELWSAATLLERKETLRLMFHRINVEGGRIAALQPTAATYPLIVAAGATGDRIRCYYTGPIRDMTARDGEGVNPRLGSRLGWCAIRRFRGHRASMRVTSVTTACGVRCSRRR
jgi:hypothetical protein